MRGTLVVYRRELGALFAGPLAWALLFVAFLLNGYMLTLIFTSRASLKAPVDITAALEMVFGGALEETTRRRSPARRGTRAIRSR